MPGGGQTELDEMRREDAERRTKMGGGRRDKSHDRGAFFLTAKLVQIIYTNFCVLTTTKKKERREYIHYT
jgi:hypothetical protein